MHRQKRESFSSLQLTSNSSNWMYSYMCVCLVVCICMRSWIDFSVCGSVYSYLGHLSFYVGWHTWMNECVKNCRFLLLEIPHNISFVFIARTMAIHINKSRFCWQRKTNDSERRIFFCVNCSIQYTIFLAILYLCEVLNSELCNCLYILMYAQTYQRTHEWMSVHGTYMIISAEIIISIPIMGMCLCNVHHIGFPEWSHKMHHKIGICKQQTYLSLCSLHAWLQFNIFCNSRTDSNLW